MTALIIFLIVLLILFLGASWLSRERYTQAEIDSYREAQNPDEYDHQDVIAHLDAQQILVTSGDLGHGARFEPAGAAVGRQNNDDALSRLQVHRAGLAQRAVDGHVRSTKALYERYFQDELQENQNREWWGEDDDVELAV